LFAVLRLVVVANGSVELSLLVFAVVVEFVAGHGHVFAA
jgi:hypothetical protein